jgi:hypothetical protein
MCLEHLSNTASINSISEDYRKSRAICIVPFSPFAVTAATYIQCLAGLDAMLAGDLSEGFAWLKLGYY